MEFITIARIIDKTCYSLATLSEAISIDESKGNAGRKFQCILTNPKKHQVLDILPQRTSESLNGCLKISENKYKRSLEQIEEII